MPDSQEILTFWEQCRVHRPDLPSALPEAWAFGATPGHADELLDLVLAGIKTGTSSSLWDCEHEGEPIPQPGQWNILLDGAGTPRAVVQTTHIDVVPFSQVSAEHAYAEGEDDRSLESWREVHERFWRQYSTDPRGFSPTMPVVCERFTLVLSSDDLPRADRS